MLAYINQVFQQISGINLVFGPDLYNEAALYLIGPIDHLLRCYNLSE